MSESNKPRERVNILGPVLLIAIGVVLLLNTMGVLEWSVWLTIIQLWPVLLIAAGLDLLLGRRSIWGSILASVLVIGVLAGALWLAASDQVPGGAGQVAQEIQQPLGEATSAEVQLSPAIGRLAIEALPEAANLVEGTIYHNQNEEVQETFEDGTRASYSLRSEGGNWVPFGTSGLSRLWELGLTPGAALDLEADVALGEVHLDLTGLQLERLKVSIGLGGTQVTLPTSGSFEGSVESGIGVTEIVVPDGMAVRIEANTALAFRNMPDDYEQDGNVFTSPGFDDAENRVELTVNQPMGGLTVRPVE